MILPVLLLVALLSAIPHAASLPLAAPTSSTSAPHPRLHLTRRAFNRATNTSTNLGIQTAYAVRWMDPSKSQFGATLNVTFNQPTMYTMHWALRFRLADNATQVTQFWGSWQAQELIRGWYQIIPTNSLRLNDLQQVYFSFNGVWNTSNSNWNTTRLLVTAMELQCSDPSNSSAIPIVYQLKDAGEFVNAPIPFETPATPFGNFVRTTANPGSPIARIQGALPAAPAKQPTTNFVGTFIVEPMLMLFISALLVATFLSWRWRRMYRVELAELKKRLESQPLKVSSPGEPGLDAKQDNAYASYYMLMDGTWDHQVVRDGEAKPLDMYGRPYSVAPVVTDAYTVEPKTPGKRTTILIPGKEYRMTLMQRGVQMPDYWYPEGRSPPSRSTPSPPTAAQQDSPIDPVADSYEDPFNASSLPAAQTVLHQTAMPMFAPPRPPPYRPNAQELSPSPYSDSDATSVQSRGLASARMRKDMIQPVRLVAETVPAVEGAVTYSGKERETMIEREASPPPPAAALTRKPSAGAILVNPALDTTLLDVDQHLLDQIALSPVAAQSSGGPASHGTGASPPHSFTVADKPLPAVGGWNMI